MLDSWDKQTQTFLAIKYTFILFFIILGLWWSVSGDNYSLCCEDIVPSIEIINMVLLSLNNTLFWFVSNILSFKGGLGTLWSSVLRQPLNFASAHFWTQRGCEAGKHLSLKKWWRQREGSEANGNGGLTFKEKKQQKWRWGKKEKRKIKEPRMDAPLIALNHSVPLCLHRCVDTTSANTQGRCWLPLVINGRKMT